MSQEAAVARHRILIEASKLADAHMDGIKRYVVELLTAFKAIDATQRPRLDVLINDAVYPLEAIPPGYLGADPNGNEDNETGGSPTVSSNRLADLIGACVPPGLFFVIRAMIPAWACPIVFGKQKHELRMPPRYDASGEWLRLLLPPITTRLLFAALPFRVSFWLRRRGLLRPEPKLTDTSNYDLIHLTLPNNAHYFPPTSTPRLLTVHDLCHISCPQFQTWANVYTLRAGLEQAVEDGTRFLAVSEATRSQILDVYQLPDSRAVTVLSACGRGRFRCIDDPVRLSQVREKYGLPSGRFLLTLSTIEPRKNLVAVVRAFALAQERLSNDDISLVIAGRSGWKAQETIRAAARAGGRVILTGYIDDDDLAAVYSCATGFAYVSHYEGFGFPLLEAMQCGTPVIYGDNSSMPEVVGEAGLGADADSLEQIADAIVKLFDTPGMAADLRRVALKRAADFSWELAAQQTLKAYQDTIAAWAVAPSTKPGSV